MTAGNRPMGWPFLVARGRRRGYSTLLAPHQLIAAQDYGFLEEAVGPVPAGQPYRHGTATTARGRSLTLLWAEHPATEADLVDAAGMTGRPSAAGQALRAPVLRDEHSRPLLLAYGFVCAAPVSAGSCTAVLRDLARCREAALATYRRFLADEDGFMLAGSDAFALTCAVPPADRHQLAAPAPDTARPRPKPGAAVPATTGGRGTGTMGRRGAVAAVGGLLVALAAGAFWLHGSSGGHPPPGCPAPATTVAASPTQTTHAPATPTTGTPAPAAPHRTSPTTEPSCPTRRP